MNVRGGRSAPEWITFALSCAVLAVVAAALVVQLLQPRSPAAPTATVSGPTRHVGDASYVDVTVRNDGHETAANVQVSAQLEVDGTTSDADQVIDFLAGGETHDLVFVFTDDPDQGQLEVTVTGFSAP